MKVFIYALKDPTTGFPRYVGRSNENRIKGRLKEHLQEKRLHTWNHKLCWIRALKRKNMKPVLQIIDTCDETNWQYFERYWIRCYTKLGFTLTNSTAGGEGHTKLDTKRVISEKQKSDISHTLKKFFKDPENLKICAKGGRGSGGVKRNKATQYVGVSAHNSVKKPYLASISHNLKYVYLGIYNDIDLAAQAYDKAALFFRGSSAVLNFPDRKPTYLQEDLGSFMENIVKQKSCQYAYISFREKDKLWIAKDTKDSYIGCFKTEQEAVNKVVAVTGLTVQELIERKSKRSMNRKRDVS